MGSFDSGSVIYRLPSTDWHMRSTSTELTTKGFESSPGISTHNENLDNSGESATTTSLPTLWCTRWEDFCGTVGRAQGQPHRSFRAGNLYSFLSSYTVTPYCHTLGGAPYLISTPLELQHRCTGQSQLPTNPP